MKNNRVGERFRNKENLGGYEFIIVEYNKYSDVLVQFRDEHKAIVHTQYGRCKDGGVKNPYHPNKYGGYLGEGEYKCSINGKHTKEYKEWYNMLERCYDEEYQNRYPTYKDVMVDEYFHNFQNFAEWCSNNYYEIEGETMCLDKDVLYKGNKIYAPDKCIFVPHRINLLFVKCDNSRGNLPIGVFFHKTSGKYIATCRVEGKTKHSGYYNTPEEAFLAYKEFKENYIKQVADEYKDKIPKELYDAMYKYEIDIND